MHMPKLPFSRYQSLVAIVVITFFIGVSVGTARQPSTPISDTNVDLSPFWKAWEVLDQKYMPTSTTTASLSTEQRVYGAIAGMVASLNDPYTVFFPPVEAKAFAEEIRGNFEGVGMEVGIRDEILTVVAPLKGTPAYHAGLKAGDKIIEIDKISTQGLSAEKAVKMIRGEKGTTVTFTVVREGKKEPLVIPVVRDVISIPTIDTEIRGDVFIIHLYNFSENAHNLFRDALREFVISGKHKLILDLRSNPGGYLESAVDMASWFLPQGKAIVIEDFRDTSKNDTFVSKGYDIFNDKLQMVILVDGGSASASEILAGALREHGVAQLVGTKTFGKGSVQELVPITSDTSLKVTIARWLTPKGVSISNGGITPDVEVKLDEEKFKKGIDTQIEKALEILQAQP